MLVVNVTLAHTFMAIRLIAVLALPLSESPDPARRLPSVRHAGSPPAASRHVNRLPAGPHCRDLPRADLRPPDQRSVDRRNQGHSLSGQPIPNWRRTG